MNLLGKVKSGMGCPTLVTGMQSLAAKTTVELLLWPYWSQREWIGRQTFKHRRHHILVYSLARQRCWKAEDIFWTWSEQSITALIAWWKEEWRKEMVEKDLMQTNIGTVYKAALGRLLRGGLKCVYAFLSAAMTSGVETESQLLMLFQYFQQGLQRVLNMRCSWLSLCTCIW